MGKRHGGVGVYGCGSRKEGSIISGVPLKAKSRPTLEEGEDYVNTVVACKSRICGNILCGQR